MRLLFQVAVGTENDLRDLALDHKVFLEATALVTSESKFVKA